MIFTNLLTAVQETADLVTFTEEILNGKLHFLCSDLTKFGTMVLYLNSNKMAHLENCTNFYMTS